MGEPELVVRAVGTGANEGRLSLSELARLAGELQATIERIALALRGSATAIGRRPRDIVDAVRLELVGFQRGSAVLQISPPESAAFGHQLLDESLDIFMGGLVEIERRTETLPQSFTPQVLNGLIRLTGGLSPQAIAFLEIGRRERGFIRIDEGFRDHVRWLRARRRQDQTTIVGRLHEAAFAPMALRCRIDTVDATIPCSFTGLLRESVLEAMDSMVVATGIAELQADGRVRSVDLDDLTVIDEAKRRTVEQIAREQGIALVQDFAEFATLADMDDQEFDHFMQHAMSARS